VPNTQNFIKILKEDTNNKLNTTTKAFSIFNVNKVIKIHNGGQQRISNSQPRQPRESAVANSVSNGLSARRLKSSDEEQRRVQHAQKRRQH
jgi:hypothetical protein